MNPAAKVIALSPRQFRFLSSLADRDRSNGAIQSIIEEAIRKPITRQAFYHVARRLEESGFVTKERSERSSIRIYHLTEAGRAVLSLYLPNTSALP